MIFSISPFTGVCSDIELDQSLSEVKTSKLGEMNSLNILLFIVVLKRHSDWSYQWLSIFTGLMDPEKKVFLSYFVVYDKNMKTNDDSIIS